MLTASMTGCVTSRDLRSHELIGSARAPIAPESVQLYLEPPARSYEPIAVLHSSSRRSWSFTSQSKADVVVRRLKEEAASLGANGVLLDEIVERPGRFRASGVLAKKRLDRVLRRQGTFERVAGGRDAEHPRVRRAIE